MLQILKIEDLHYNNIVNEYKKFEVRNNYRNYKVDDIIVFTTVDGLSIREGQWKIHFIHDSGYGMKDNFVILGIKRI
jgi:hypothetical protein